MNFTRLSYVGVPFLSLLLATAGCMNETEQGGPDATADGTTADNNGDESTFSLILPSTDTEISPGATATVTITIDRTDTFDQPVDVEFTPPEGVTVEPASVTIDSNDEEVQITLKAEADTPQGKKTVRVKGTPQSGTAVDGTFQIDVTETEVG